MLSGRHQLSDEHFDAGFDPTIYECRTVSESNRAHSWRNRLTFETSDSKETSTPSEVWPNIV